MLLSLSIFLCVFPTSADIDDPYVSENNAIDNSIENKNFLEVKADYTVTVKEKIKVSYKIRKKIKVKVRYKKKGKWRTKYKTKYSYVYKYYYKTVYRTYKVRDIPPAECKAPSANCQPTDPNVLNKARELSSPITETLNNTDPAPEVPAVVEKPAEVQEPGIEPTLTDFGGCETEYQEAWNAWNESNTNYTNYLAANQTYTQYLQDYANYQKALNEYQPYINVTRNQTTMEKAKSVFEFVRDNLAYSFYFNTQRGAAVTLRDMRGNCCDHAHLVIALARACGIPARYVHGTCKFNSGDTYGHVWAQIYVDGKWYNADAISYYNTLGTITNWNTATYTLKGIYSSLPF